MSELEGVRKMQKNLTVEDIVMLIDKNRVDSDSRVIIKDTDDDSIIIKLYSRFITDAILNMEVDSLQAYNDIICIRVK